MLLRCTSVGWAVSTGTDQRACSKKAMTDSVQPAVARMLQCVRHAALARGAAGDQVGARAADVVQIFGNVGEMREVAEGAHHDHRLVAREAVEDAFEFLARREVVIAAKGDRALADALDQFELGIAFLARARCRRAGGRAGGCPRAAGDPCRGPSRSCFLLVGVLCSLPASGCPAAIFGVRPHVRIFAPPELYGRAPMRRVCSHTIDGARCDQKASDARRATQRRVDLFARSATTQPGPFGHNPSGSCQLAWIAVLRRLA